jgi:hypothetical protein
MPSARCGVARQCGEAVRRRQIRACPLTATIRGSLDQFLLARSLYRLQNLDARWTLPSSPATPAPAHKSCSCSARVRPQLQSSFGHKCSGSKISPKYMGADSQPHWEHVQRTPSFEASGCWCRCVGGLSSSDVPDIWSSFTNRTEWSGCLFLFLRSDWVEKGQHLFHVTAPAERADAVALLVIVKTRLFGEGFQTITAMQKV